MGMGMGRADPRPIRSYVDLDAAGPSSGVTPTFNFQQPSYGKTASSGDGTSSGRKSSGVQEQQEQQQQQQQQSRGTARRRAEASSEEEEEEEEEEVE